MRSTGPSTSSRRSSSGRTFKERTSGRRAALLLALLFFLAFLPALGEVVRYHTDEAYYTDAAIRMRATGDWVTPRASDGSPRFQKPILTYWVVATSYAFLGVSLFSSRILFLAAGALIVFLTYRLALRLFRDETAAIVAAAFAAGNSQLMYAALRSVPDVLLGLAMTASLLGFAGLYFVPDPFASAPDLRSRHRDLVLAYAGAGAAVATKGLLGLILVLYGVLFALWRGRKLGIKVRDLIAPGPIAAGVAIALFWFALAVARHGDAALSGFFTDQVASRIEPDPSRAGAYLAINIATYLMAPFRDFLPWPVLVVALALVVPRARLRGFLRMHREASLFVLGWFLLLLAVFSGANLTRPRYLLPVWPPLAGLLAALALELGGDPAAKRLLARLSPWILLPGLALAGFAIAAGLGFDRRLVLGGAVLAITTLVLFAFARQRGLSAGLVAVSLFMLVVFAVHETFVRPSLAHSPAPEWTTTLLARGVRSGPEDPPAVLGIGMPRKYLSQVRVMSGGRVWPVLIEEVDAIAATGVGKTPLTPHTPHLLAAEGTVPAVASGFRIEPCGFALRRFRAADLWRLVTATPAEKAALYDAKREPYYLGIPASSP